MKKIKTCEISSSKVLLDGKLVYASGISNFPEFAKECYKFLGITYPKFYKMDALSKLAFLSAEFLLRDSVEKDTAIVLANTSASLDTDIKHQASINNEQDAHASPAVFVYTLPNICIGEIAIRHQLLSENAFFVLKEYNADFLKLYAEDLLKNHKAKRVLCGWTELLADNYKGFVYLLE